MSCTCLREFLKFMGFSGKTHKCEPVPTDVSEKKSCSWPRDFMSWVGRENGNNDRTGG